MCSQPKTEKKEDHHWILHIRISLGAKLQLQPTILMFWTKFTTKKGYLGSKTEKMNIIIQFFVFELVWVRILGLNWQFWFFGTSFPNNWFLVENSKRESDHWILHIQISLGTKFQLKLTILIFSINFVWKGYFYKTEHHHCIHHIQISLGIKFWLKLTISIF